MRTNKARTRASAFAAIALSLAIWSTQAQIRSDAERPQKMAISRTGEIGQISPGMSQEKFIKAAKSYFRSKVIEEGDEYDRIEADIGHGIIIEGTFDESGNLARYRTKSKLITDESGSGPGTTLGTLRIRHPTGRFIMGDEDGRYANFYIPSSFIVFEIDRTQIPLDCFDPGSHCVVAPQTRVTAIFVQR